MFENSCHTKICSKCGQEKSRSEFNKEDGKERAYCKICHRQEVSIWQKENREHLREYHKKWSNNNKDKIREYARNHYKNQSIEAKQKKSAYSKKRHLERKYGITQEKWDEMFTAQGGVCALCKIPGRTGKHGKLAVDHCHKTGKVRGLLCASCNVALGILGDSRERIERVLEYVCFSVED